MPNGDKDFPSYYVSHFNSHNFPQNFNLKKPTPILLKLFKNRFLAVDQKVSDNQIKKIVYFSCGMWLCGSKQNQLFGLHSRSQFSIPLGSFVYIRFCLLLAFAEHKKRLKSAFLGECGVCRCWFIVRLGCWKN